jgi:hypothetical protein
MMIEHSGVGGQGDLAAQCRQRMSVLKMIHKSLVAGPVMFGLVVFIITKDRMTFDLAFRNTVTVFACVVAVISVGVASQLSGMVRKAGRQQTDFDAVWPKYMVFVLMRAAIIEGGALFSAVAVMLTGNILPWIPFAVCAVALAVFRPTQQEFIELFQPERTPWTSR